MKFNKVTILIHVIVWLLLFIIPYASTDQVFEALDPSIDYKYLSVCSILSLVLLFTFYLNYFLLIPKFLIRKKYWIYYLFLLGTIAAVLFITILLLVVSDFTPEASDSNPIIEKVIPVIMSNNLLLWFITIISSILWTMYSRLNLIENEKFASQIAVLKSQINPHFLFNTLNNIYATAYDESPKAAAMIEKLSEMMRYSMMDAQIDFIPLEDEINYLNNYIELQQIRFDNSIKLNYELPSDIPDVRIAPMLLIPFIENSFKHGVNSEQESSINILINIVNSTLTFNISNKIVEVQNQTTESSGLGIQNTKHRLELIYPSNFSLLVSDYDGNFSVILIINLQ